MEKNLAQVTKLLEKVFKAGFLTEKDILAVQLEDLVKIPDITGVEIKMLVDLKVNAKLSNVLCNVYFSLHFED